MVAHYSASGWLSVEDDDEGLIDLVSQGAMEGRLEPLPDTTEYRVLADGDARFELWLFAAHGQVRGAVPFLRGTVSWDVSIDRLLPRITGGLGAIEVHRPEDPDQTLCVEIPDFARLPEDGLGQVYRATVTGLAYLCRMVPQEEESFCFPRFYPYGILGDNAVSAGEGSRCDVLACGTVSDFHLMTNPVTGLAVHVLELDIDGMPFCVAAAPGQLEGGEPEIGRVVEGVFWLVGRLGPRAGSGVLGKALQRLRRG